MPAAASAPEHRVREMLEGGGGWSGRLLRGGLWLPGALYGCAMRLRRAAYGAGWIRSGRAAVPVVSVGNLTAGGSGKTPFTAMLARELLGMGLTPGILLRGYRRTADGESDEALLYARLCPGALVETGADRLASAGRAVQRGATVLLLDDGFQHLRLQRDLDIVLVDAFAPWGGGMTLPGGLLREPRCALSRAGVAVVTRSDQLPLEKIAAIKADIARLAPAAPILCARHAPARLTARDGAEVPLDRLRGMRVLALSGIARPEAFVHTLRDLGAEVVAAAAERDHADFSPADIASALEKAESLGAVAVTTEKDIVKKNFSVLADNNNIWALEVRMAVDDPGRLMQAVRGALAAAERRRGAGGWAK